MFTKEDTKKIKGIAILLMLAHHLWGFQARMPLGFSFDQYFFVNGVSLTECVAIFGNVCVSIYMFLGGYGLYMNYHSGRFSLPENILKLYKNYWKVFFIFVPIGFIFFSNQIDYCEETVLCSVFSQFNLNEFVSNLIGLGSSYNREWWFFRTYLCTLFSGIFYLKVVKKSNFWAEIFYVILWALMLQEIFPILSNQESLQSLKNNLLYNLVFVLDRSSAVFLTGIVFAKHDIISKMRKMLESCRLRKLVAGIGIIGIIYVRDFLTGNVLDIFLVPCFIVFCLEVTDGKRRSKVLTCFGKHSTNMWLIHSFYCYYFLDVVNIVYSSKHAMLSLLILVVFSLLSSIMVEKLYQFTANIGNRWIGNGSV